MARRQCWSESMGLTSWSPSLATTSRCWSTWRTYRKSKVRCMPRLVEEDADLVQRPKKTWSDVCPS